MCVPPYWMVNTLEWIKSQHLQRSFTLHIHIHFYTCIFCHFNVYTVKPLGSGCFSYTIISHYRHVHTIRFIYKRQFHALASLNNYLYIMANFLKLYILSWLYFIQNKLVKSEKSLNVSLVLNNWLHYGLFFPWSIM